ncbi:MAG: hypothetical protein ACI9OE_002114 [Mariniflexile sp.]|jgi:hypothetical protein
MSETHLFWFIIYILFLANASSIYCVKINRDGSSELKYLYFFLIVFLFLMFKPLIPDTDAFRYVELYDAIRFSGVTPDYLEKSEFGFLILNQLFATMDIDSNIFFSLLVAFQLLLIVTSAKVVKKELALFVFFLIILNYFAWSQQGIRQAVAISIFFYSLKFIVSKNIIKYTIAILLASLFHITVILLWPLYFIYKIKFNVKTIFTIYTMSLFSVFFINSSAVLGYFLSLSNFEVLSAYEHSRILEVDEERTSSGIGVAVRMLIGYFVIFKFNKMVKYEGSYEIYFYLYLLGQVAINVFYGVEGVARVGLYFLPVYALVMARCIMLSHNKLEKTIAFFVCILSLVIYLKVIIVEIKKFPI